MNLQTPLPDAGRVYKMYAKRLEKLGITKLGDFLLHIPHRYDDYSLITPIRKVQPGEVVTIQGTLVEIKNEFTRKFKKIQRATVQDGSGSIDILWFNQPFIVKSLQIGDTLSLSGRIGFNNRKLMLTSPDYEVLPEGQAPIHTGRLVPIYPETAGVSSKWIRRQVYKLLQENKEDLQEYLPETTIQKLQLPAYNKALEHIHFPDTLEASQKAKERLAFDELFLLQLAAKVRKQEWQEILSGNAFEVTKFAQKIDTFFASLPFTLTAAQRRSIEEIFADVVKEKPMNRMLEGDVGSGKTIVAAVAMYLTYLNGYQSILMAPTQILAQQHYNTIKNLLEPFGVTVDLITGAKRTGSSKYLVASSKNKNALTTNYQLPATHIFVGTHAVLSENIRALRVGFVVIDEQQRFGVEQRALLREKGKSPHVLTMTATPIPRTVALALYGDLDLSILDEMPQGRLLVKTWLVPNSKRDGAYQWIEEHVKKGEQVFIVCPFIEESESMTTVKAATVEFERLKTKVFPKLSLAMLHGRMKPKEKDQILEDFRKKKYDILVATPVVEVGIDIPNATIILIEAADRFGLSQLHQLRGRVGRGDKQSYCLLFSDATNTQTTTRLKALETMHNGASLAELDLQIRGAGELYGTLQHGRKFLKIASFGDFTLIEKAKQEVARIFPKISQYPILRQKIEEVNIKQVSPD